MKRKSGKIEIKKAALMVLVLMIVGMSTGQGQMVSFLGKLPSKKEYKRKYKCEHIGVQKVKHEKIRVSAKAPINRLVLEDSQVEYVSNVPVFPSKVIVEKQPIVREETVAPKRDKDSVTAVNLLPLPVYFRYDSYRMDIIDLTQISIAVNIVTKEGKKITLVGHTDNWGSEQYNEVLSHKRATIIKDLMVKLGCNPEQIDVKGEGEKYPISTNDHEEGRLNNRRVEFIIEAGK